MVSASVVKERKDIFQYQCYFQQSEDMKHVIILLCKLTTSVHLHGKPYSFSEVQYMEELHRQLIDVF